MDNIAQILIADDNKGTVKAIREQLEKANFSVLEAFGGQEEIDLLQKEKVDLAVIDLFMPQIAGDKVVKWLRKNLDTQLQRLQAILISEQIGVEKIRMRVGEIRPNTYCLEGYKKLIEEIKNILKIN